MGWTFGWDTKDDLVRELLDDSQCAGKIEASHLAGNELWTVIRLKDQSKVIVLFLVEKSGQWGYKSMDECMGPYFYKCPLSFLELVPVASESCVRVFASTTKKRTKSTMQRDGRSTKHTRIAA